MNSLYISKALVDIINTEVEDLNKFSPCVVPEKASYPLAVYRRTSQTIRDSKDLVAGIFTTSFELAIVDSDYDNSLKLAQECIDALYRVRGTIKTMGVIDITIDNCVESFENDAYIQQVSLTIKHQ